MLNSLAMVALVAAGQIAEAPDRLISPHGVEISSDGRVFVLFAALNALGYSEESKRKGPPLEAPVFHPLRERTRDALRNPKMDANLKELRKLFDEHPASIEVYLAAILGHDLALKSAGALGPDAAKLDAAIKGLRSFGTAEDVGKLFDEIALEQRRHALTLMEVIEKDFDLAEKKLGQPVRGNERLVVVPNPLDSHDAVRFVSTADRDYLVVGPGRTRAQAEVLAASIRPPIAKLAAEQFPNAKFLKKHWDGLKISKRITDHYPDGPSYLAETLSRIFVWRIRSQADGKPADEEDFIDAQNKDGMRWTRAVLRALDDVQEGEKLEEAMPKIVARANP